MAPPPQVDSQYALTVGTWVIAVATFILAIITVFQDWLRSWIWHPVLSVTARTSPPDCISIPMVRVSSGDSADSIYLRVFVENSGNEAARNVEVYAKGLTREQTDGSWAPVQTFPSMNLRWSWFHVIYLPYINPHTGRHCDIGHIIDPSKRTSFEEENPTLNLTPAQVSLAFDLIAQPNNRTHIVQPGNYRLRIEVAAENAHPVLRYVEIKIRGPWYGEEQKMLSDGVGIRVL